MIPPIPYLDEAGYLGRTKVAPQDVEALVALYPGYLERKIARGSSWINSTLAKRYDVPLGQAALPLVPRGAAPPVVGLTGRPVVGSLEIVIEIVGAGALGSGTFWWSLDGGQSWSLSPVLAASGSSPPAVGLSGAAQLELPSMLEVVVTTAGTLGRALFVWTDDGALEWHYGSQMAASGSSPPAVGLTGTSTLAIPNDLQIQITTAGTLGVAYFQWSQDGGSTWTTGLQTSATPVPLGLTGLFAIFSLGSYATNNAYQGQGIATAASVALGDGLTLTFPAGTYGGDNWYAGQGIPTAPSVALGSTGLTATFSAIGTYATDQAYSAATPVPEIALGWLTAMLDVDVWDRRGANPQDPTIARAVTERDTALAEIKEAANSDIGLFDLPTVDTQGDSAIRKGGPLAYTEASPFVAADRQEREGRSEDEHGGGTFTTGDRR